MRRIGHALAVAGVARKASTQESIPRKQTHLATEPLAARIYYEPCTVGNCLKDSVQLERIHYIRSFCGRKIIHIWEAIEHDIVLASFERAPANPDAVEKAMSIKAPVQTAATSPKPANDNAGVGEVRHG